jgi:hypothetical protein
MTVSYQLPELKLQHGETQMLLELLVQLVTIAHLAHLDNQLHALQEHLPMLPMLLLKLIVFNALKHLLVKKELELEQKINLIVQQVITALQEQVIHTNIHAQQELILLILIILLVLIVHHAQLDFTD